MIINKNDISRPHKAGAKLQPILEKKQKGERERERKKEERG